MKSSIRALRERPGSKCNQMQIFISNDPLANNQVPLFRCGISARAAPFLEWKRAKETLAEQIWF